MDRLTIVSKLDPVLLAKARHVDLETLLE